MVMKIKDFFKNLWSKIKKIGCTAADKSKKNFVVCAGKIKHFFVGIPKAKLVLGIRAFFLKIGKMFLKIKSYFSNLGNPFVKIRDLFLNKECDVYDESEDVLFDAFDRKLTSDEDETTPDAEVRENLQKAKAEAGESSQEDISSDEGTENIEIETDLAEEEKLVREEKVELSEEEEMRRAVEFAMDAESSAGFGISGFWSKISVERKRTIIYFGVSTLFVLIVCFFALTTPGRNVVVKGFSRLAAKMAFSKVQAPSEFQQGGFIEPEIDPFEEEIFTVEEGDSNESGENVAQTVPEENPKEENKPGAVTTQKPLTTNTPKPTATNTPTPTRCVIQPVPKDSNIINVLLIGEENVYGSMRGRSDAILIGSFNKKTGAVSLVSLFRDAWVELPDYPGITEDKRFTKLNSAYAFGGAELLLKTVEKNFGIVCDSYVIVDFSGFEKIIDILGGVDIKITEAEAQYLNTTNYISDKKQRKLVAGVNHMSGNQALGYCRIRRVIAINGEEDDFGRTFRQRTVLNCIFDNFKKANYNTLVKLFTQCFEFVNAPSDMEKIAAECLRVAISKNIGDLSLKTCNLPASKNDVGSSSRWEEREFVGYNEDGKEVYKYKGLGFDAPKNAEFIRKFLYGY